VSLDYCFCWLSSYCVSCLWIIVFVGCRRIVSRVSGLLFLLVVVVLCLVSLDYCFCWLSSYCVSCLWIIVFVGCRHIVSRVSGLFFIYVFSNVYLDNISYKLPSDRL
jgi:hypothetical protein